MIWNEFASLTAWEISTFILWTLFCIGCLQSARKARGKRSVPSYGALWMGGFMAAFLLLQVVRIRPALSGDQSIAHAVPHIDPSKLPNVASARY
jgi:hypothetical protein